MTTYTYNAQGQVLTVLTPKAQGQSQGATTTFTNNPNGYLTQVSGPVPGANTTFTYDAFGRRRTVTDPAGLVLTYDYDNLDRVRKVTYPDWSCPDLVDTLLKLPKITRTTMAKTRTAGSTSGTTSCRTSTAGLTPPTRLRPTEPHV